MFSLVKPTPALASAEYDDVIACTKDLFRTYTTTSTDTISIVLPSTFHFHVASTSAAAVAVCNPIDPHYDWQTLASVLQAAETKVLVTVAPSSSNTIWPKVEQALQLVPTVSTILQVDMNQYLPYSQQWSIKACDTLFGRNRHGKINERRYSATCQQFDFDSLIERRMEKAVEQRPNSDFVHSGKWIPRYAG